MVDAYHTLTHGTRFAPTPTGELHLGNMRTALVTYLAAKKFGYRHVLRMDDLDPLAVKPGAIDQQLDDLQWLGLTYDEGPREGGSFGPYAQSQRFEHYERCLTELNEMKLLYPCWCSRKEVLAATLAPHASDEGPIYPGTCRPQKAEKITDLSALPARNGRVPALRINVARALRLLQKQTIVFSDEIYGEQHVSPLLDYGDFVVRRKDGIAAYQLACAYDDHRMQCGLVLRGDDLLMSTGRQLLFFELFQWTKPTYAHIGLVLDSTGERLSKRDRSISVKMLRQQGVDASDVLQVLAETVGISTKMEIDRLVSAFTLDDTLKNPVLLPSDLPWDKDTRC